MNPMDLLMTNIEYQKIVKDGMAAFWKICFSTDPDYRVFQQDNILRAVSNINDPLFNSVIESRIDDDSIPKSVTAVIEYYATKKLSFCWWVNAADDSPNLPKYLEKSHFAFFGNVSGMVLDLEKNPIPNPSTELEIIPISSQQDLANWIGPIQQGFGMSDSSAVKYLRIFEKLAEAAKPSLLHFIAKSNDKVIASASLFLNEEVAGIYNCATLPEHRQQGALAALTSAMLKHAKQAGYQQVTLQASPMSVNVFRKFGFIDIIPYQVYLLTNYKQY
jgi:predicted GNAT family acetyltransferase